MWLTLELGRVCYMPSHCSHGRLHVCKEQFGLREASAV